MFFFYLFLDENVNNVLVSYTLSMYLHIVLSTLSRMFTSLREGKRKKNSSSRDRDQFGAEEGSRTCHHQHTFFYNTRARARVKFIDFFGKFLHLYSSLQTNILDSQRLKVFFSPPFFPSFWNNSNIFTFHEWTSRVQYQLGPCIKYNNLWKRTLESDVKRPSHLENTAGRKEFSSVF